MTRRTGLVSVVAILLVIASLGVYALHVGELPASVGFALFASLVVLFLGASSRFSPAGHLAFSAVVAALGLGTVWVVGGHVEERAGRIVRDFAWAQALVGGWMTYLDVMALSMTRRIAMAYDDVARARWRQGDVRFGADLAGHIIVSAQPSWAALVVETAWPEPRPDVVDELLQIASTAGASDIAPIAERMKDKGGTDVSDARWTLARLACDVVVEARGRERDDVGGLAVGKFVVAAAKTARDDDEALRIFAALVLPAIARRG
jgi:hypothetical protein